MSEIERRKLSGLENEGVRLACQAKVTGKSVAIMPEDPLKAAVRKQLMRQEEDDKLW
jgi:2Fe-2S ferredoxin